MIQLKSQIDTVYHGSNAQFTRILARPSKLVKDHDVIFATSNPAAAICFAGARWTDKDFDLGETNGVLHFIESRAGNFNKFFNCSGCLYELPAEGFEKWPGLASFELVSFAGRVDPIARHRMPNVLKVLIEMDAARKISLGFVK